MRSGCCREERRAHVFHEEQRFDVRVHRGLLDLLDREALCIADVAVERDHLEDGRVDQTGPAELLQYYFILLY